MQELEAAQESSTSTDTETNVQNVIEYAQLLSALLESERFRNFVEQNFTIQKNTDPDTKQTSVLVIEKPFELVQSEMTAKIQKTIKLKKNKIKLAGVEDLKALKGKKVS